MKKKHPPPKRKNNILKKLLKAAVTVLGRQPEIYTAKGAKKVFFPNFFFYVMCRFRFGMGKKGGALLFHWYVMQMLLTKWEKKIRKKLILFCKIQTFKKLFIGQNPARGLGSLFFGGGGKLANKETYSRHSPAINICRKQLEFLSKKPDPDSIKFWNCW